jgi:hypothetical protein
VIQKSGAAITPIPPVLPVPLPATFQAPFLPFLF